MKIVVIGQFDVEDFGFHIAENLKAMGYEVVACISFKEKKTPMMHKVNVLDKIKSYIKTSMLFASKDSRYKVLKPIFNKLSGIKCDLVICTYDYFLEGEVDNIRSMTGAKVVMWFPDHIGRIDRGVVLTANYDALFYKEPYFVRELFNIYRINAFYLPEAFSKLQLTPTQPKSLHNLCDILVIASLHSARVPILKMLIQYDLKLYGSQGPWWLDTSALQEFHTGKFLANHDKANAIQNAKIVLNTVFPTEIEGVNARTFEYAGAGGFQLMEYKKALPDLFEIGKEVVTYKTIDEMIAKIDYYLQNDTERSEIALAGKIRAWKDHDYQKRLTRLINMTFKQAVTDDDRYDYRILE